MDRFVAIAGLLAPLLLIRSEASSSDVDDGESWNSGSPRPDSKSAVSSLAVAETKQPSGPPTGDRGWGTLSCHYALNPRVTLRTPGRFVRSQRAA